MSMSVMDNEVLMDNISDKMSAHYETFKKVDPRESVIV